MRRMKGVPLGAGAALASALSGSDTGGRAILWRIKTERRGHYFN